MENLEWYHTLNQPALHPPDWIFAPVWTILYILMAVSVIIYLTREIGFRKKLSGLIFFIIQLVLNLLWSPLFFYYQQPKLALAVCFLLIFTITFTAMEFYKKSKLAAYFLIPYLLWTIFALYLNFEIVRLN